MGCSYSCLTQTFGGDDDLRLFASFPFFGEQVTATIVRINHNDPEVKRLRLCWTGSPLPERESRRLGCILARSKHLEELTIATGWGVHVAGLCSGLRHNDSIRKFSLSRVYLGDLVTMCHLAPFFTSCPNLESIDLHYGHMRSPGVNVLARSLLERPFDTLKKLDLSYNRLSDDCLGRLVSALIANRHLAILNLNHQRTGLGHAGIGYKGCVALAKLLRTSNLRELRLYYNSVDDDSAAVLADALSQNTCLDTLWLGGNDITSQGWMAVLKLVCSYSSIDGMIERSNHTLADLGLLSRGDTQAVYGSLRDNDADLLHLSLRFNGMGNKTVAIRCKILWGHALGYVNICESSIAAGVMPCILAHIGNYSNEEKANSINNYGKHLLSRVSFRLDSIFRILRSMPHLCVAS